MSSVRDDEGLVSLLRLAHEGDDAARQRLLSLHRDRLRHMVEVRLDVRVRGRVDASDVVQEVLIDAAGRLDEYLGNPPLPFYPWLRQFALLRLARVHKHHINTQKRNPEFERAWHDSESVIRVVRTLTASTTSPSHLLMRDELEARVHRALEHLKPQDNEILELLYLENLSNQEAASVLGISVGAVRMRHVRALRRLQVWIGSDSSEAAQ